MEGQQKGGLVSLWPGVTSYHLVPTAMHASPATPCNHAACTNMPWYSPSQPCHAPFSCRTLAAALSLAVNKPHLDSTGCALVYPPVHAPKRALAHEGTEHQPINGRR